MRIGVLSDTHGNTEFLLPAIEQLVQQQVEQVLHCGDIGSPAVVQLMARWPVHYVLGNCDHARDEPRLRQAIEEAGGEFHDRFGDLTLGGRRIALLHGDDGPLLADAIHGGQFDLVCSGHTHEAACERVGDTVALNPGALFRANPHTLAVVDLPELKVTPIVLQR